MFLAYIITLGLSKETRDKLMDLKFYSKLFEFHINKIESDSKYQKASENKIG